MSHDLGRIGAGIWLALYAAALGRSPAAEPPRSLTAPGAELQKLADGFAFAEGPACDAEGNIYFSDVRKDRIHMWSLAGELSTFREDSGGANGLYFDRRGNLLVCEGDNRRLTSISPSGEVAVLASRYRGKQFNSPNDLWIDPRGGVYFTDPRYGRQRGLQQDGFHVYYLTPDRKQLTRVIDDLVKPNGVVGAADGRRLYVADPGADKTYSYEIQKDGSLDHRQLLASEGSDGLTLDEYGNVYLTHGAVHIYSPDGKKIADIATPEWAANVCFGGKDRRTLFITARSGLYSIRMNVRGQPPAAAPE